MKEPKNTSAKLFLLLGLLFFLFLTNISTGSVYIPLADVAKSLFAPDSAPEMSSSILWKLRLPKALTGLTTGAALAVAGLLMQTLFRNPLAGPDVLGLSSGASLAVAFVLLLGTTGSDYLPGLNVWSLAIAASAGSGLIFLVILGAANKVRDNTSLLIIGLMVAAAAGSLVSVLQYLSTAQDLQAFVMWTLGSIGGTNWNEVLVITIILVVGIIISVSLTKTLNTWLLGDNYAISLGVNLKKARITIVLVSSILVGGVTAFCGPITFVGLAVPHLVRLLVPTTNHKILLPLVMIGGASLMLLCDILTQLPGSSKILPLNAITSIIGAPVVIWVVLKSRGIRM